MQNFPLIVSQDEINLLAEGMDALIRKPGPRFGANLAIPVGALLTKMMQAQPIVEAEPMAEPKPTTADDARAIGDTLKPKNGA